METLGDNLVAFSGKKMAPKYYCEICDYECSKKYNWEKHILTSKHICATKGDKLVAFCGKKGQIEIFVCEFCDKEYQHRQGLWRHKKICQKIHNNNDEPTDKQLIMMLIKENSELRKEQSDVKEMILEIVKNGTMNNCNNTTTTHTNSHNKAFNLNFFLNETCKNAMNITDFVDSIKLQLSDFIEVGELGYVEGISKIIVKNLNALDETVRPIHCTDKKRETFYVKDENKWEKEEEDMKKIKKMIKKIAYKNERLMSSYKEKYPDYNDPDSKNSDKYSKTVIEALGGTGNDDIEKENKIIRHISRATTIKNK
jgi:hypothetical protein